MLRLGGIAMTFKTLMTQEDVYPVLCQNSTGSLYVLTTKEFDRQVGAIMWDTIQGFDGSHSQVQNAKLWYSPLHAGPSTTHHPACSKLDQQRSAEDH